MTRGVLLSGLVKKVLLNVKLVESLQLTYGNATQGLIAFIDSLQLTLK